MELQYCSFYLSIPISKSGIVGRGRIAERCLKVYESDGYIAKYHKFSSSQSKLVELKLHIPTIPENFVKESSLTNVIFK